MFLPKLLLPLNTDPVAPTTAPVAPPITIGLAPALAKYVLVTCPA